MGREVQSSLVYPTLACLKTSFIQHSAVNLQATLVYPTHLFHDEQMWLDKRLFVQTLTLFRTVLSGNVGRSPMVVIKQED